MECRDVKYILRRGTMDMMEISIRIRSMTPPRQWVGIEKTRIGPGEIEKTLIKKEILAR